MKKFNNIIKQDTEPVDTNVLWLKDGVLYEYEGGWKPVLKSTSPELPSPEENNTFPIFKKGDTNEIKNHNMLICDLMDRSRINSAIVYIEDMREEESVILLNVMVAVRSYESDKILDFYNPGTGEKHALLNMDGELVYNTI